MKKLFVPILCCCLFALSCRQAQQTVKDAEQIAQPNSPIINSTQAELDAIKTPCDDAADNRQAEECLRKEFEKSDRDLNELYAKILNDLQTFHQRARQQDEVLAEKYKSDEETLRLAQDYWVNYRKFNCKAEREITLDQPNAAVLGLSCFERMTEERIENLKAIYQK